MPMLMLICRVSADEDIPRQPDTVPSLLFCFFSKNERSIYTTLNVRCSHRFPQGYASYGKQRSVFASVSTRMKVQVLGRQ